jgi:ABC-type bacteriocin/lantibiotic exporter with double-glycine peptidase domain
MTNHKAIDYTYADGGRSEAGYKGTANDCAVRAIAIYTNLPYKVIYDDMRYFLEVRDGGSPRNGILEHHLTRYLAQLGFRYKDVKNDNISLGSNKLPKRDLIVILDQHVCAIIKGTVHDSYDPNEMKPKDNEVLGYWVR